VETIGYGTVETSTCFNNYLNFDKYMLKSVHEAHHQCELRLLKTQNETVGMIGCQSRGVHVISLHMCCAYRFQVSTIPHMALMVFTLENSFDDKVNAAGIFVTAESN
jgi:hypothetical protein